MAIAVCFVMIGSWPSEVNGRPGYPVFLEAVDLTPLFESKFEGPSEDILLNLPVVKMERNDWKKAECFRISAEKAGIQLQVTVNEISI